MRGKKNVVTSGSGITKRTHEILPFMDGLKKLAEHNRRVTARGKGAFGSLESLLNTIEDESNAILEKKGIPTDEIWPCSVLDTNLTRPSDTQLNSSTACGYSAP